MVVVVFIFASATVVRAASAWLRLLGACENQPDRLDETSAAVGSRPRRERDAPGGPVHCPPLAPQAVEDHDRGVSAQRRGSAAPAGSLQAAGGAEQSEPWRLCLCSLGFQLALWVARRCHRCPRCAQ